MVVSFGVKKYYLFLENGSHIVPPSVYAEYQWSLASLSNSLDLALILVLVHFLSCVWEIQSFLKA